MTTLKAVEQQSNFRMRLGGVQQMRLLKFLESVGLVKDLMKAPSVPIDFEADGDYLKVEADFDYFRMTQVLKRHPSF